MQMQMHVAQNHQDMLNLNFTTVLLADLPLLSLAGLPAGLSLYGWAAHFQAHAAWVRTL
jgi:hypothetical protein